jgi:hypothetical protein
MGKRGRERRQWPKKHDEPAKKRMVRVWICVDCRKQGCTLVRGADGYKRCITCNAAVARLPERSVVVQP